MSLDFSHSIGLFDSGVGGLTVMKELKKWLPHENILYFGDTARVPYGGKSPETVIRYSLENTIFLMERHIKLLVVACNTASALALDKLQHIFKIPIIGVIAPGAKKAVEATRSGRIAVIGTRGTINSGAYQREIQQLAPQCEVFAKACPLFVPLVEEDSIQHRAAKWIVEDYLLPLKNEGVDTVLLGCTHYPLLQELIHEVLGPDVRVVDSASTCAEEVKNILKIQQIEKKGTEPSFHQFFASDDPEKFRTLGAKFLGCPITSVEHVPTSWMMG